MSSPGAVRAILTIDLGNVEDEVFGVLLLDARSRLIDFVALLRGRSTAHPSVGGKS
jgi:DNA repair protein RadC